MMRLAAKGATAREALDRLGRTVREAVATALEESPALAPGGA